MKTSFGHFEKEGREFVVTELKTPRALVNYFWNPCFISGVSQHGGGEGVYKERAIQYVDLRGRNILVRDCHRYFYLRDQENGDVWCPGWHPVQAELDSFSCTHATGYSVIRSERGGIASEQRVFVPEKDPAEIWTVTLTNNRPNTSTLKLYTFVDFALEGYPRYGDYFSCLSGESYPDLNAVQCCNRAVEREHDVYDGFLSSDTPLSGFETSKQEFLGSFGHVNAPRAVMEGTCTNILADSEYLAGVLEHTFEIPAGESRTVNILIGASNGYEMTKDITTRLLAPGAIDTEFAALNERKSTMLNRLQIETPNKKVNYLINNWIKQQIQIYADVGSDNGRGFRDAMQLLWATASFDLAYTRRMLIECLSHQYAYGQTLRGWMPVDDHHYSDGTVWIAPVIDAYLKESGDYAFLDEIVPFFDEGEGTVWEHILRALRHSSDDTGEHGMTLCHFGDWNDSLTGVGTDGKGESVWVTQGIIYGCNITADIATRVRKDDATTTELLERAARLTKAVHDHAWDGEWYIRAINDLGDKVGTHTEEEGYIWLLPQVWAILAEIDKDNPEREAQLLRMVDEHLESKYGSRVLTPAFTKANPRIGRITLFRPGMWENGTAYCHSNGFKIIADCVAGRGDKAYLSFRKAMPDSEWNPSTESGCEPYVLTNQFLGEENRRAGKTLWGWMTGASGWYYRAMSEWMLGVRPDYDGLRIDPCLPSDWTECSIERDFRGARYHVSIHNPDGLQKGVCAITVDGEAIEGDLLPFYSDGKTHDVQVTMSKA